MAMKYWKDTTLEEKKIFTGYKNKTLKDPRFIIIDPPQMRPMIMSADHSEKDVL